MTAEFKADQSSVDAALAVLLQRLAKTSVHDIEVINDKTWHAAAEFDVDQTALESALAASGWFSSPSIAQTVIANCTTTLVTADRFDSSNNSNRACVTTNRAARSGA